MEEVKRKPSKFVVNKDNYMGIRVDLNVPLSALWMLEQARDMVKQNLYRMQQIHQEAEKKNKIEQAKIDTKQFLINK